MRFCNLFPAALGIAVLGGIGWAQIATPKTAGRDSTASNSHAAPSLEEIYRKLPLGFEANVGQTDARVKFVSRRGTATLFLTADEAVVSLSESATSPFRMTWLGGNREARVEGADEFPGKSNYLVGNRQEEWHTNVPIYGTVRYRDLYPGVDLVYYGNQGQLEFDLAVSPGGRSDAIVLGFDSTERIALERGGDLTVRVGQRRVRLHKPAAYQLAGDRRIPVEVHYKRKGAHAVGFDLAAYDRSRPVIIDPQLTYSTYLGGSANDTSLKVAVDSNGFAYLVGASSSANYPVDAPFQQNLQGTTNAVIAKLNPEAAGAASLVYATYLGGTGTTTGRGIAVNGLGQIFISGDTSSPNLPVTAGAYQTSCKQSGGICSTDVFAAKVDATGSALLYGTYLGGTGTEFGFNMTIDGSGHMFITGPTGSADFPVTTGAFQTTFAGGGTKFGDAFVAELNPAGGGASDLLYATYLGGAGSEQAWSIAVDSAGAIYVTGSTTSADFPLSSGAYQRTYSGSGNLALGDAFVTKLVPLGQGLNDLVYSTYLGGADDDRGEGIAVDAAHLIYVTGFTLSSAFPVIAATAYDSVFGGGTCNGSPCGDAFVAKLNPAASGAASLVYSTFLGGSNFDLGHAIALDQFGLVYVTGETASLNFPLVNPIQSQCAGGCTPPPLDDIFIAKMDLSQSGAAGLLFSTYLGGNDVDTGWGIAVDTNGNAYVTGQVFSTNLPTMLPFQAFCNGCISFTSSNRSGDGFLVKVCTTACPVAALSPASLPFGNQQTGTTSSSQNITLTNSGSGNMTIAGIILTGTNSGDFAQTNNCPAVLAAQISCTIQVTFRPSGTGSRSAAVTIADNGGASPQAVSLSGTGTPAVISPWPNGYTYQATFTVASGKVPATLSGFPVLISGAYADFKTQANGGKISNTCIQTVGNRALTVPCDLIFTSDPAGSVLLSWEFESYSAVSGVVNIWVNAPSLASGTTVYAWYGNSSVSTLRTIPSATWGPQFLSVWHLPEDPSGTAPQLHDSTNSALVGTTQGSMTSSEQVAGQIGGAISGNGTSQYVQLAAASSTALSFERTDSWSTSGWYRTNANGTSTIVSKQGASTPSGWAFFVRIGTTNPTVALAIQNNGNSNGLNTHTTNEFPQNTWHHAVATYNGTSSTSGVTIYVDGQVQGKTDVANNLSATVVNSYIGALGNRSDGGFPTNFLKGTADEIRVYAKGTILSANWVTAEYNNQSNPATFFNVATGITNPGTAPAVGLSPSSLSFGNQTVNTASTSQGITVTNNGPGSLNIATIAITGVNSADYSQTNNCPATLAVTGTCTINVRFTPTATGTRSASVSIADNGVASPQSVVLSGSGVVPAVGFAPPSLSFGNQTVNTVSASQNITVTNNGPGSLTITTIVIAGVNSGDYSQTNNCPATLAVNGTCTVTVRFTPTATGTRSASVAITDNGVASPQSVALSGTGTAVVTTWPNGYSYQATFTVAAGKVPGTLSGFPVLISGIYPDFRTQANGGRVSNTCTQTVGNRALTVPCDLIFTSDSAGSTLLSWEFESYGAATGTATIWVKAPSLSSGTTIYAWYGNSSVGTLRTTPSATWGPQFVSVWHLAEDPSGTAPQLNDSTANGLNGTTQGSMSTSEQVAGQMGGAISGNGTSQYAKLAAASSTALSFERTDSWSVSFWYRTNANGSSFIVSKEGASTPTGWAFFLRVGTANPTVALAIQNDGNSNGVNTHTTAEFPQNTWHHAVATYNGTSSTSGVTIYVDGQVQGKTDVANNLSATVVNSYIGALGNRSDGGFPTNFLKGTADEIRVYARGTVLSANWVTAEYNNQSNPGTFLNIVLGLVN